MSKSLDISTLSIAAKQALIYMSPTPEVGASIADISDHLHCETNARNVVRELQRHALAEHCQSTDCYHLTTQGVKVRARVQRDLRETRKAVPA